MMILDPFQAAVAASTAPATVVTAGPGSGKTAALAGRVAELVTRGYAADQIVALTYTRTMAGDLRQRIALALPDRLGCARCGGTGIVAGGYQCGSCAGTGAFSVGRVLVGTLHSVAAQLVRKALRGDLAGKAAIEALRLVRSPAFSVALPEDVDDMVAHAREVVGRRKIKVRELRDGLQLVGDELNGWPPNTAARLELWRRDLVTFDDLLRMLEVMASATDGRPLREAHPALVVDEAQDLSPLHWRILRSWSPKTVTLVGDDAQAIFGFMHRDGDAWGVPWASIWPAEPLTLARNYRAAPEVVEACSAVRAALAADGACSDLHQQIVRSDDLGVVDVVRDWQGLLDQIRGLTSVYPLASIAVLAPTWADLVDVQLALTDLGIASALPEDGRSYWRTIAARSVVAMARCADRGGIDPHDAETIVRSWGREPCEVARAHEAAMRAGVALHTALDAEPGAVASPGWWTALVTASTCSAVADAAQLVAHVGGPGVSDAAAMLAAWRPDAEQLDPPISDWLVWLASSEAVAKAWVSDAIALATIHAAKGLEWPAVVVMGACEGSIPPGWASVGLAETLEWGRCLYVAMSRSRDWLVIHAPAELREKPRRPSPWLVGAGIAGVQE